MEHFREITVDELVINPFTALGQQWALLSAGSEDDCNTMTVAWGGMGVMWSRNVIYAVVRPQRYTYEFMERFNNFSLAFFPENMKDMLRFCGTNSGRDGNKIEHCKLTPFFHNNAPCFEQAELQFVCEKKYFQDIDPSQFLDPEIHRIYPEKDYHRMYVGEIISILTNQRS